MINLLKYLMTGDVLTAKQAETALKDIASGHQNEAQVAAFLMAYNMRMVTADELKGFRKAMLSLAAPLSFKGIRTLDIVGTGGDGKNTFNISTLACFVCAGAGAKVTKHGNYGVSSVSGASNVVEQIGITFATTQEQLNKQLEAANITFLHAPLFHPAMKNVAHVRKQLGLKTIFNLLGPICNPAKPDVMLLGVHSETTGKLYRDVMKEAEVDFAIVHALDGYDEISLTDDTRVMMKKSNQLYTPRNFGFNRVTPQALEGGNTIASNARIFMDILRGKGTEAQNSVVLANAAMAISLYENNSYNAALEMAKKSLFDGKALACLNQLKSA